MSRDEALDGQAAVLCLADAEANLEAIRLFRETIREWTGRLQGDRDRIRNVEDGLTYLDHSIEAWDRARRQRTAELGFLSMKVVLGLGVVQDDVLPFVSGRAAHDLAAAIELLIETMAPVASLGFALATARPTDETMH